MRDLDGRLGIGNARRELGVTVTQVGGAPWFVMGCDGLHAITEAPCHFLRIIGKTMAGIAFEPTAVVLQSLR